MGAFGRTALLFLVLTAVFVVFGWAIGSVFFGDWVTSVLLFLLLAGAMNAIAYFFADKIVLWSYRAKEATEAEAPQLYRVVQRVAGMNHLPMPRVYIVPTATPNAFATGRNPKHAVVAVTQGLFRVLDEREMTAVIAHEMAHVKDRDILVMSVAATVAGAIAFMSRMFWWNMWLGGRRGRNSNGSEAILLIVVAITAPIAALLVQLAISRSREYKADVVGSRNSGAPDALADALQKLERGNARRPIEFGNPASASLFIVNPFRGGSFVSIFSTHPPIQERVRRLREMAQEIKYGRPMPAIHPA